MTHARSEEGMALVMALSILVVLGMLGAVVTTFSTAGQRSASHSSAGVTAYSLAEAGINNAVSVISKPNNAMDASLLPGTLATANVTTYQNGYVRWWGAYDAATTTWTLSSTGYARNPNSGTRPITRTITVRSKIRAALMQPTSNPIWNYIVAMRTGTPGGCDESLNNSVNIQSPMYVLGNLCMNTPSQITGGPLMVHGYAKLDVNTNVGSAASPVNEVHVRYGCAYKDQPFHDPCTSVDKVWAGIADASPITLTLPTADFPTWYVNAAPGPRIPCTTSSGGVPVFDNDTVMNNSVPTIFNLTPPASSYDCTILAGSRVVARLAWDYVTKKLTILGTVFIDGSVEVNYGFQNVPIEYDGTGTIYTSGTVGIKGTKFCASIVNGTACNFSTWNPSAEFLVFVASGQGGQVPVGDSIQVVSGEFEGGLFATYGIELDNQSSTEGPMLAGTEIFDNSVYARTWPLVTVPVGMPGAVVTEAHPDPPSGYTG
jgi:hypothetical protein